MTTNEYLKQGKKIFSGSWSNMFDRIVLEIFHSQFSRHKCVLFFLFPDSCTAEHITWMKKWSSLCSPAQCDGHNHRVYKVLFSKHPVDTFIIVCCWFCVSNCLFLEGKENSCMAVQTLKWRRFVGGIRVDVKEREWLMRHNEKRKLQQKKENKRF